MLSLYLAFILHRFFSGIRNGCIYTASDRNSLRWAVLAAVGMTVILFLSVSRLWFTPDWAFLPEWIGEVGALGCALVCLASTWLAFGIVGGKNKFVRDLHLWTLVEQTSLAGLFLLGCGSWEMIALLLLAVYPSVVLQKMAINGLIGKNLFYEGTDDPNGKYWSLPSLGIKVSRSCFRFRIPMAIISIIAYTYLTIWL